MNFDISNWKIRNVSAVWFDNLLDTFRQDKRDLSSVTLNQAQYSALCTNLMLERSHQLSNYLGVEIKVAK